MKASLILTILATLAPILSAKPHQLHHHNHLYRLFHAPGQDLFVRGYADLEEHLPKNQPVS